jgi:hypothetical protein
METQPAGPEELPTLYRAILDGVAALERIGERREAQLIRRDATRHYSAAWDDRTRRRLHSQLRRIERVVAGHDRPRRERAWSRAVSRRVVFGR